jgi:hypothetical protein
MPTGATDDSGELPRLDARTDSSNGFAKFAHDRREGEPIRASYGFDNRPKTDDV